MLKKSWYEQAVKIVWPDRVLQAALLIRGAPSQRIRPWAMQSAPISTVIHDSEVLCSRSQGRAKPQNISYLQIGSLDAVHIRGQVSSMLIQDGSVLAVGAQIEQTGRADRALG